MGLTRQDRRGWMSAASRRALLAAAGPACPLCGEEYGPDRVRHIDHVIPLAAGGWDVRSNVRVICGPCNLGRPRDCSDLPPFSPLPGQRILVLVPEDVYVEAEEEPVQRHVDYRVRRWREAHPGQEYPWKERRLLR